MRVFPTNGFPPFDAEPSLVDVHSDVQAACDPKGEWTEEDEWTGLANWSFHQALWAVTDQSTVERDIDRDEVTALNRPSQMSRFQDACIELLIE